MIYFKISTESQIPRYMTQQSAGADIFSSQDITFPGLSVTPCPTGLWIERVDWDHVPKNFVPEIQIRCRSSFALKHGIMLANGVGTIDIDYPDEIKVLLWNSKSEDFLIKKGERVAQMVIALTVRSPQFEAGGVRHGGFGSTGK